MIKPEMVGQTLAVFTAVEVKTAKGKVSLEQQRFIDAVLDAGGIGVVARSVEEAEEKIFLCAIK